MCLVSYVPLQEGFVLTSNRDEAPSRANITLKKETINNIEISYPAEIMGGSWIFTASDTCLCILNGAFKNHERVLPYKMSRGLMIKAYFEYKDHVDFLANFQFKGIEPFTLIMVVKNQLFEFRWDGAKKYITKLSRKDSHVWSSCTLYTDSQIEERKKWFFDLLKIQSTISKESLKEIHQSGGQDNLDYGFLMNRADRVATISITQALNLKNNIKLEHQSLSL